MAAEQLVGLHRMWLEGDVAVLHLHGDVSEHEAEAWLAYAERSGGGSRGVYVLCDLSQAGELPPAVRAQMVRWVQQVRRGQVAMAFVHATPAIESVFRMMRVANALRDRAAVPTLAFFQDEPAAREWLRSQGARLEG